MNKFIIICLTLIIPFMGKTQFNNSMYINDSVENEIHNELKNNDYKKNTVYFELFGNGVGYSFNYDRILEQSDKRGLSVTTGFSIIHTFFGFTGNRYTFPQQISWFYGVKHRFEFGFGYTFEYSIRNDYTYEIHYFLFRIGYRYQDKKGGLFCRVGLTPLINTGGFGFPIGSNSYFWPIVGGAAIGYTF